MNRPFDSGLEVVGHHGQVHGIAGEGHGDPGAELDPLGVLGRQHQGQERVVVGLGRPEAVVADPLGQPGRLDDPARVEPDASVDVAWATLTRREPSGRSSAPGSCIVAAGGPQFLGDRQPRHRSSHAARAFQGRRPIMTPWPSRRSWSSTTWPPGGLAPATLDERAALEREQPTTVRPVTSPMAAADRRSREQSGTPSPPVRPTRLAAAHRGPDSESAGRRLRALPPAPEASHPDGPGGRHHRRGAHPLRASARPRRRAWPARSRRLRGPAP